VFIRPQLLKIQKDREMILNLLVTLPKSYIYDLVYNDYVPADFEQSPSGLQKEKEDDMYSEVKNNDQYDDEDEDNEESEDDNDNDDDDNVDEQVEQNNVAENVQEITVSEFCKLLDCSLSKQEANFNFFDWPTIHFDPFDCACGLALCNKRAYE
jgi:hypothetical protein